MPVALIIGGNSDIGLAIAREFSASGVQVAGVGLDRSADPVWNLFIEADCSRPAQADAAVAAVVSELGRLETIVLAAARMPVASAAAASDDDWRSAMGATLDSAFFVSRAALPHLSEGASIVAITSVNASRAAPGLPGYAAAKAGVEGLMRQLALEYGPKGIRVNAVAPGTITSEPSAETDGYPLGRVGTPREVAAAVAFLASDRASFITGVTLPVDGGLSISSPAAWLKPALRDRWL